MKEQEIQNAILEYLGYKNIFHYRQNSGAYRTERGGYVRYGAPGAPDIIVVKSGKYIGLEVKTPTGKQSPAQKDFEQALTDAGGEYHILRSVDDVIALF